jgi:hypothetical protein
MTKRKAVFVIARHYSSSRGTKRSPVTGIVPTSIEVHHPLQIALGRAAPFTVSSYDADCFGRSSLAMTGEIASAEAASQ